MEKTLEELGLKKQRSLVDVLSLLKRERLPADMEIVFVVDTTGSMGSFINQAKQKDSVGVK